MDSPLTAEGRSNVEKVAERISGVSIDAIATSPLGRAVSTATIFGEVLSLEVEVVDDLVEIDHGLWTGLTEREVDVRFPGERRRRAANLYEWPFPGGESYADGDRRAASAIESVSKLNGQRMLIVSHAMIGRLLLRNLLDLAVDQVLGRPQPHGLVRHVDLRSQKFADVL